MSVKTRIPIDKSSGEKQKDYAEAIDRLEKERYETSIYEVGQVLAIDSAYDPKAIMFKTILTVQPISLDNSGYTGLVSDTSGSNNNDSEEVDSYKIAIRNDDFLTYVPKVGDIIEIEIVNNEITKFYNLDGYYFSTLEKNPDGLIRGAIQVFGSLVSLFSGPKNGLDSSGNPSPSADTSDLVKQAKKRNNNIDDLNPQMKEIVLKLIARLKEENLPFFLYETRRTLLRQKYLFSSSRTTEELRQKGITEFEGRPNEPWATGTLRSNHLTGDAVDMLLDLKHPYFKDKKKPNGMWDVSDEFMPLWLRYRQIAKEEFGLYTLVKDWPHVSRLPEGRSGKKKKNGKKNRRK